MLAGFLLIAVLLSGAALQSWRLLAQFAEASRHGNEQALLLNASIQELAEHSVDLERSARQYLVLKDASLLERFDEHARLALRSVEHLSMFPGDPLAPMTASAHQTIDALGSGLHQALAASELLPSLDRLAEINSEIDRQGRRWIEAQQTAMLGELAENRRQLAWLVATAIAGAFVVALAMSWWLTRPIARLERSIEQLGESRFDEPIAVRGPADLRQVGRRLDWLRQRLGELEADRQQSLRHVSHELKTPLAALREGISLLQEEVLGRLEAPQQEVVAILKQNALTLQRQIEGLLRLNAAAFDARRRHTRPVDLADLLAEVARERELQIQARQLAVQIEAPPLNLPLDREKMRVVLDNLLSNAIDFSPDGGSIRLHAKLADGRLRIDCIDAGPGIAAGDEERIFAPFTQGKHAAPTPRQGSGVGLSIVRELVGGMGGEVSVIRQAANRPGAHFRIELPYEVSL